MQRLICGLVVYTTTYIPHILSFVKHFEGLCSCDFQRPILQALFTRRRDAAPTLDADPPLPAQSAADFPYPLRRCIMHVADHKPFVQIVCLTESRPRSNAKPSAPLEAAMTRLVLLVLTCSILIGCTDAASPAVRPTATTEPIARPVGVHVAAPTASPTLDPTYTPTQTPTRTQTLTPTRTVTPTKTTVPAVAPKPTTKPATPTKTKLPPAAATASRTATTFVMPVAKPISTSTPRPTTAPVVASTSAPSGGSGVT